MSNIENKVIKINSFISKIHQLIDNKLEECYFYDLNSKKLEIVFETLYLNYTLYNLDLRANKIKNIDLLCKNLLNNTLLEILDLRQNSLDNINPLCELL